MDKKFQKPKIKILLHIKNGKLFMHIFQNIAHLLGQKTFLEEGGEGDASHSLGHGPGN